MNSSPARVANNMHKHLYKSPGGFAHGINQNNVESPTWRDAYKKKCFEEFKKSRQKLITKFRKCQLDDKTAVEKAANNKNTLKDYLDEELEKICLTEASASSLISYDEAIEIYKQIQIEMASNLNNNNSIGNQPDYADYVDTTDDMIDFNNSCVICPLCQKCELNYTDSKFDHIYCKKCSFKINTNRNKSPSYNNKLTLETLSTLLNTAVSEHNCTEKPNFELIIDDESDNPECTSVLLMNCNNCKFMKFII